MEKIVAADLPVLFSEIGRQMEINRDLLTKMDAEMGDGDLGLTMSKGFRALPDVMADALKEEEDLGKLLFKTGMKLSSIVPSTMGILMASGIAEGGKALIGRPYIGAKELTQFLRNFCNGVARRGKCQPGDRTVLDAMNGAAKFAEAALDSNPHASLLAVADAARQGAIDGVENTKGMLPKFGKAVVHRAKALGMPDQGAVVGGLCVAGIYEYIASSLEP